MNEAEPNTSNTSINVLGVDVSTTNLAKVNQTINEVIQSGTKGYITVTGTHGIVESQSSLEVLKAHNQSLLTVPDGMPLVWIGRLKGFRHMDRCYGPDLMLSVINQDQDRQYRHFYYGGAPGVADELKRVMETRFPEIQVVGTFTPPFRDLTPEEDKSLIDQIKAAKPDIIWVGLSTPKQELFMHKSIHKLDTKIMVGVGAAFDFHTGRVKQAPHWVQRSGLEWLYRLLREPKRLWKRYFKVVPLFIALYTLQALGIKKYQQTKR